MCPTPREAYLDKPRPQGTVGNIESNIESNIGDQGLHYAWIIIPHRGTPEWWNFLECNAVVIVLTGTTVATIARRPEPSRVFYEVASCR